MGVMQSVIEFEFLLSPLISGRLLGITSDMPMIVGGVAFIIASAIMAANFRKEISSKALH